MSEITQVSLERVEDVLQEIESAFYDIPFGNTDFQCENFVVAGAITPARAYRIIGLQMHSILTSLRETKYARRKLEIDILELQEQISDPATNKYDRMRKEIELEKLREGEVWSKKLVADSIRQLNLYYAHFKRLPRFTREEFEKQEQLYFEQTQRRQLLGITGAKEAIMNMMDDKKTIEQFESACVALSDEQRHAQLENLVAQSMAGMIEFKGE